MDNSFVVAQIMVCCAIVFDVLSFQFKEKSHIVICLTISCLLISGHFALLNQWTAMALVFLSAIRCASSIVLTSKKMMFFFIILYAIATVWTYSGLLSVLSCCGSVLGTIGTFCTTDKRLREILFLGSSFWLVHNILVQSPGAIVMECLFIGSNVVGYYRHYLRRVDICTE